MSEPVLVVHGGAGRNRSDALVEGDTFHGTAIGSVEGDVVNFNNPPANTSSDDDDAVADAGEQGAE